MLFRSRPLDIGVLEGSLDSKHRLTVPLSSGGEGRLELDEPPTSSISLRLIRSPVYARPPDALTLPPPTKWPGWRVLEAASLLGLAVWLLFSWRSTEQKSTPGPVPGSPGVPRSAPTGPLAGRVTDAHTGHPIAASVRIFTVGPASEELALSVQAGSDGSFRFTRPSGVCRLRAAADGYLELDGPLPAGPAAIRLVSRRRAALSLLASWFRGRTPDGPVPTPQEVGRSARSTGRAGVAEWAEEVARAAYAASPPSDADLSALAERKPS